MQYILILYSTETSGKLHEYAERSESYGAKPYPMSQLHFHIPVNVYIYKR